MRTGLIAAVKRTTNGGLRAELPLAGRSVLAWQIALLQGLGVERILCLCEEAHEEVLRLQQAVEATGQTFHVLKRVAAIPALVRGEDELVVLRDGLVPDFTLARTFIESGAAPHRVIACLPADHPLAVANPDDFERIDARRHWAGLLMMRGAPVQHLADFPPDADAVSVLLRLALQAGTPCREVGSASLSRENWLLADDPRAVALQQNALIERAVPAADWRAPLGALAVWVVARLAPRGLGHGALGAAGIALILGLLGLVTAALGWAAVGCAMAALAAFSERVSTAYSALGGRLRGALAVDERHGRLSLVVDALMALILAFALSPWPQWQPLAVCGPLAIGLARLAAREGAGTRLGLAASDRASQLGLLALAGWFGLLHEAVALLALAFLAALLLRKGKD